MINKKLKNDNLISVYVPTTPNPTSGFFLYVPESDVIYLDISVDEALKTILSTGIINPTETKSKKRKTTKSIKSE